MLFHDLYFFISFRRPTTFFCTVLIVLMTKRAEKMFFSALLPVEYSAIVIFMQYSNAQVTL